MNKEVSFKNCNQYRCYIGKTKNDLNRTLRTGWDYYANISILKMVKQKPFVLKHSSRFARYRTVNTEIF